jgi:hypothetical protein
LSLGITVETFERERERERERVGGIMKKRGINEEFEHTNTTTEKRGQNSTRTTLKKG